MDPSINIVIGNIDDLQSSIDQCLTAAENELNQAETADQVQALKVRYLGKKGALTALLKNVSQLDVKERPLVGKLANQAKQKFMSVWQQRMDVIAEQQLQQLIQETMQDVSMPARSTCITGALHPVTKVRNRCEAIFSRIGFEVAEGPEIEDDYHNFSALNIPQSHPARAMQDTFYFKNGMMLRTHTSPVQIRSMKTNKPPLKLIAPGKVFRRDSDQTHTPMFHQLEGLVIDKHCNFAQLKGLLHEFVKAFFGVELKLRFRPSYFPFTEPSAEVDMQCTHCMGEGCRVCSHNGWLEVLGCGMVHPNVLTEAGIDPDQFSGYAFGIGLDRMAMLLYKMDDLRALFENRVELLSQFRGVL